MNTWTRRDGNCKFSSTQKVNNVHAEVDGGQKKGKFVSTYAMQSLNVPKEVEIRFQTCPQFGDSYGWCIMAHYFFLIKAFKIVNAIYCK